jgi:hypothetical protein
MVAIMVTVIIMMVISLIVIGFTRVIRREQRQVLDRQLSTQAFYAAESGVNDVADRIPGILDTNPNYEKDDCADDATLSNVVLDASTSVQVTCTLVDPTPQTLVYSGIGSESKVVPIISKNPAQTIQRIRIVWRDEAARNENFTTPNNCNDHYSSAGGNRFPPASIWNCTVGIMRIDLVPTQNGVFLSRSSLQANAFTALFYPGSGGSGSFAYATARGTNQGAIHQTRCTAGSPAVCTMEITGLAIFSSNSFHMRMKTLYGVSNVTIEAGDLLGNNYELRGAQALVDVTGKANDVLRRIQVRVPASILGRQNLPDFALQTTDDICKRLSVVPNINFISSDCPGDPY